MIFIAFGLILAPLYKTKTKIPKNIYIFFALIALTTISTYHFVGDPAASITSIDIVEIDKSIASLEESLTGESSDIGGWQILAEAYAMKTGKKAAQKLENMTEGCEVHILDVNFMTWFRRTSEHKLQKATCVRHFHNLNIKFTACF